MVVHRWLMVGMVAALMLATASTVALWRCWTAGNQRAGMIDALEMVCLLEPKAGSSGPCEGLKAYRQAIDIWKRLPFPDAEQTIPK